MAKEDRSVREIPRPFDNDDELAAAAALQVLSQLVADAATAEAQAEAFARVQSVIQHEEAKQAAS